jgi:hypothetical protein
LKTTSNYLFLLIQSMTRNEKGYFKKQVMAHSHEPDEVQYLKLFDAVEKQEVYNEPLLLEKFKEEKFISQFSVAKNYLTYLILKSLVQYHAGKSSESILNRELDFSDILFSKGFYRECITELAKAKKLAYKFDKHDYILTIIKKEKHLLTCLKNERMIDDLQELLEEEQRVLETLRLEGELGIVYYRFINEIHRSRIRSSVTEYEQLHQLMQPVIHLRENELPTFNSKSYFYGLETIYSYLINDFEKAVHFGRMHRNLWESDKERFEDENDDYLEVMYHYISACFQVGDYAVIDGCLQKIRDLEPNTVDKKQRKYFMYYTLRLRYCASLALYDESKRLLEEIEHSAGLHVLRLNTSYRITLCINCAITYFVLEEYKKALHWLNSYLNNLNKDFRKDAYSFARIFNLMIHYKLGNTDLMEHVIKNTYREIRRQNNIFEYEKAIVQFIKRIARDGTRKKTIMHAQDLQKQLKVLQDNPLERDAMRYFNYIRWLESEIRQVPYRTLVEQELGR